MASLDSYLLALLALTATSCAEVPGEVSNLVDAGADSSATIDTAPSTTDAFDDGTTAASDAATVEVSGDGGCAATDILCGVICVDPSTDPFNCGGCGKRCGAGAICVSGTCSCGPPTVSCGGSQCIDTSADPKNCGGCGITCADDEYCGGSGTCACRPGLKACGGACVNTDSDRSNCGACGNACGSAQLCVAGACQDTTSCSSGLSVCNGACVNKKSDPLNCGDCGNSCARDEVCVAGSCRTYAMAVGCLTCPCTTCASLGSSVACCAALPGHTSPICVAGTSCP